MYMSIETCSHIESLSTKCRVPKYVVSTVVVLLCSSYFDSSQELMVYAGVSVYVVWSWMLHFLSLFANAGNVSNQALQLRGE